MPADLRGRKQPARKSEEIVLSGNNFDISHLRVQSDGLSFPTTTQWPCTGDTPPATRTELRSTYLRSTSETSQSQPSASSSVDSWSRLASLQNRSPTRARKRRLERAGYDTSETAEVLQYISDGNRSITRANVDKGNQDASNMTPMSPIRQAEQEDPGTEECLPPLESPSVIRQRRIGAPKATSEQENVPHRLGGDLPKDSNDTAARLSSREAHADLDTINSGPGPAPFRNASGVPLQQNPQARNSQVNAPRLTNGKLGMLHSLL